jgi:hypothetical protein
MVKNVSKKSYDQNGLFQKKMISLNPDSYISVKKHSYTVSTLFFLWLPTTTSLWFFLSKKGFLFYNGTTMFSRLATFFLQQCNYIYWADLPPCLISADWYPSLQLPFLSSSSVRNRLLQLRKGEQLFSPGGVRSSSIRSLRWPSASLSYVQSESRSNSNVSEAKFRPSSLLKKPHEICSDSLTDRYGKFVPCRQATAICTRKLNVHGCRESVQCPRTMKFIRTPWHCVDQFMWNSWTCVLVLHLYYSLYISTSLQLLVVAWREKFYHVPSRDLISGWDIRGNQRDFQISFCINLSEQGGNLKRGCLVNLIWTQ